MCFCVCAIGSVCVSAVRAYTCVCTLAWGPMDGQSLSLRSCSSRPCVLAAHAREFMRLRGTCPRPQRKRPNPERRRANHAPISPGRKRTPGWPANGRSRAKCPVGAQGGGTLEADAEGENGGAEKGLADAAGGAGGNHCVDLPHRGRLFARARALASSRGARSHGGSPVVRANARGRAGKRLGSPPRRPWRRGRA